MDVKKALTDLSNENVMDGTHITEGKNIKINQEVRHFVL